MNAPAETGLTDRVLADRYRLGRLLGRGGMAEVYDALDERLARPVAVKVLRPEMAGDPQIRTRFAAEARAAARLAHPNVVAVYDTGEDGDIAYIVMERLPGETLADRMVHGPLDEAWTRRLAGDVLGAMSAAHSAGIVHRDVKPGNILLTPDGCAKVADFGIAKTSEAVLEADMTATGMLLGTPAYLAPERINGHVATPQSDLYAVGVVLYEALSGVRPFAGPTPIAVAYNIQNTTPESLAVARPGVDPRLARGIKRAMAPDPEARPHSADAMAQDLGVPLAGMPEDRTVVADGTVILDRAAFGARLRSSGRHSGILANRRWPMALTITVLAALLLAAVLGAAGRGGSGSALAARIDGVAGQVAQGGGENGETAAARLRGVAGDVRAGGGAIAANALLADAAGWRERGSLSATAYDSMVGVLTGIDGVSVPTTITTTTTTPPPPAVNPRRGKKGDGGSGGD